MLVLYLYRIDVTASDTKTADAVLFQLKSLGEAQAETIATRLGITVQAVRQRLDRLLAGGLVAYADNVVGRGRPRRMWSLTPQAVSLFPDTHAQLTVDLIGTIRSELGEAAFSQLLRRRTEGIAANYRRRLPPEPDIRGKLAALVEIRTAEGYMARLEELPEGGYRLIEDHCPICAAAIACQGFCSAELEVFQKLLGDEWRIERLDHLLAGARRCSYRITRTAPEIAKTG
ncbi:MAG: metalloregulator ArsR/SmtB family transcription factor [Stellaceae bacterium]